MFLNWFQKPGNRKSQASSRRHGTAARRKLSCRPQLELLEGRITPALHQWIGAGLTPFWSNPANWTGGVPAGDSNAQLNFIDSRFAGGFNDYNGLLVKGIRLQNPGMAPGGNGLTISGNIDVDQQKGSEALNMPITFNNGIDITAPQVITVGDQSSLTMGGVISSVNAAETLHKAGPGPLFFGALNTYFIPTFIDAGTLAASINQAIPAATRVFVSPGATLDLANHIDQIASLSGSGGSVTLGTGCLFTGHNNESTTFSGVISGSNGDLFKEGTGTFTLRGQNNYRGGTHINAGTLQVGANLAVDPQSRVILASNARFDLNGLNDIIGSLTGPANSTVTLVGGTLTTGADSTSTAFSGLIRGAGRVFKGGTGTWTLSSPGGISGASLEINGGSVVDNGSVDGLVTVGNGGTLAGNGQVSGLTVNNGGTLNPGGGGSGMSLVGNATLNAGSHFHAQLNSTTDHSLLGVINSPHIVNLANPTLDVALGFASAIGDSFAILVGFNGAFITGMFQGLPDNSLFAVGTATFQINYTNTGVVLLTHVAAPATHVRVSAPATTIAGAPFSVTVTALDQVNNVASGYRGIVHFTSSDGAATLPPNYTFRAGDNGVHTFTGVILKTAGNRTLTATDTASGSITGISGPIAVSPAAVIHYLLTAPPTTTAGSGFTVSVTAQDAYGNTTPAYTGTVHFTSSDGAATLPSNYTFLAGDNGAHTFTATLRTAGNQSLAATDTANAAITGGAVTITEFPILTGGTPAGIAAGPDGNLWFTDVRGNKIGKITPAGAVTEFPVPTANGAPWGITAGPDGNLWFTEAGTFKIGKITPAGAITEFPAPSTSESPQAIAAGPDGNLWFREYSGNKIGRITPAGVVTEFLVPTSSSYPQEAIAAGPDGNLWFTDATGNKIGKITPAGVVTEYPMPTTSSGPIGLAAGPDGNLWFTEGYADKVGKITPAGTITEYPITANSVPWAIAKGPDGNLWFTEDISNKVGTITLTGTVTEYPISPTSINPIGITAGPDGNLWFADSGGHRIGRLQVGVTVTAAAAASFRVTPPEGSVRAGTAFSVTVRALDPYGNTATGYTGTVHFSSTDPQATLPANSTLVNGTGTFLVTLRTSGNQTVTATDTVTSTLTGGAAVSITPATATQFRVSAPAGITAGIAFSLVVTALDPYNNTATAYTGTVHFTSSDSQAILPANSTLTNGVGTFSVTLKTAGSQTVIATDISDGSITGTSGAINVVPALASQFAVATTAANPDVAGTAFNVTVTALDPYGNTVTGYTGTVTFTSADPFGATLPADYAFQPTDQGRVTFAAGATLYTAGTWDVTITDTANGITGAANVNVQAAAAVAFQVLAPTSATSGTAFDVTVIAVDPYGNTDTNYTGTVTFTSSDTDPGVVLPADYTFTAGDGGMHTFSDTGLGETTLIILGDQTLTGTDTASGILGSATVTVTATAGPGGARGEFQAALGVRHQAPLTPTVFVLPTEAGRPSPPARESVSPPDTAAMPRVFDALAVDRLFALQPEGHGLAVARWHHATRQAIHDGSADGLLQDPWLLDGIFP